ncbi:MAG TPA: PrsW family intramembrane metalloprotease [Longimicrobium sp.]
MTEPQATPADALDHPPGADPFAPKPHPVLTWVAVIASAIALMLIGADLGPRAFFMGVVLAVVPVPVYLALALWMDRFEPEPPVTLAQTFAWGASVAVLVSILLNTYTESTFAQLFGRRAGEIAGRLVSAPVVEELSKGVALVVLFRTLRDEYDDVLDGVVYAAMVGLGFAMMENVQYYGAAIEEGHRSSVATFAIRGMLAPFAHPLFTAMFGVGLGYARERGQPARRFWAPPVGFAAAVGLHALWNWAAGYDDTWFVTLYALVMFPAFMGLLVIVYLSLVREGRIIREHLGALVEDGMLTPDELDRLCVVRSRLRSTYRAWRTGGMARWRAQRELHRMASELAFHRWRVQRGLSQGAEADARREALYLRRLEALCRAEAPERK